VRAEPPSPFEDETSSTRTRRALCLGASRCSRSNTPVLTALIDIDGTEECADLWMEELAAGLPVRR